MLRLQVHAVTPRFCPPPKCGFQGNKTSPLLKTTDLEKTEAALCRDLDGEDRLSANSHKGEPPSEHPPADKRKGPDFTTPAQSGVSQGHFNTGICCITSYAPPTMPSLIKGAIFQSLITLHHSESQQQTFK